MNSFYSCLYSFINSQFSYDSEINFDALFDANNKQTREKLEQP